MSLLYLYRAASIASAAAVSAAPLLLDGGAAHHVWDGFGGLSAGASSRLLPDYPLAQRSDILDILYLPSHGAALSICKIEIGGDVMSTDGTEPSHMHSRNDLACGRGYELWLAREALARNPAVRTFALSWGVPGWVGNGSYFSADNIMYQSAFCDCFKNYTGHALDFIGIWNERAWGGADYIVNLRRALDAAGHTTTKIVLPDNSLDPAIVTLLRTNATFSAAVTVVGLHKTPPAEPAIETTGHLYWRSETGTPTISLTADWTAARDWARQLTRHYITANVTAVITWSTIWRVRYQAAGSVLPGLPYDGRGLMMANTPWSGNYAVSAPIWVSAHFGQFLQPGWRHLLLGRGAGVLLDGSGADVGSYVAFAPGGDLGAVTLVVETMGIPSARIVAFQLVGGFPAPTTLQLWQTTAGAHFVHTGSVAVAADGTFELQLPADGIVTASTVATANHGQPAAAIPDAAPLRLPYNDSFDAYAYDALPRYLSDEGGSFAVRDGSLVQTVMQRPGGNDWFTTPDPLTLLGDYTPWADVRVRVMASLAGAAAAAASVGVDPDAALAPCMPDPRGGPQAWMFDAPAPAYLSNSIASESICLNLYGCGARLIYYRCCTGCGCADDAGFRFALNATGALTAALLPGLCATAVNGSSVAMLPCSPGAATQTWRYDATSRLLTNDAVSGACMTSPLTPRVPYVQACVRVTGYSGFDGAAPIPGYCLRLDANGAWSLLAQNVTIASGSLPGFNASAPHVLEITALESTVIASLDGGAVGSWGDDTFAAGMVAIGSGVHAAAFDDLLVDAGGGTPGP